MEMSELLIILLVGIIVFSTFTVEGIAGFGSAVMALPFVSMLIGIDQAVPMLCSLSVMVSTFIVLRSWKNLDLKEYGFIVLHVGLGVPFGLFLMDYLPKKWLLAILACFMLLVGCKGLYGVLKKHAARTEPQQCKKNLLSRIILFAGGIIQGAFSSGGPLVVMYASKALPEKSKFRASLSSLWLTTNSIMVIKWTVSGTVWNMQLGKLILCAIPFIVCGMIFGDYLHHKADQKKFTILVYTVLIIAAFMLGRNLL